jgi:hypothetical protein
LRDGNSSWRVEYRSDAFSPVAEIASPFPMKACGARASMSIAVKTFLVPNRARRPIKGDANYSG